MNRRSDSLYYDNVTRRELCDMIAHLEQTVEDLTETYLRQLAKARKEVEQHEA